MAETFSQYKQRILSYAGGRRPLPLLRAAPRRLESLVRGRSCKQLVRRPTPAKWSVAEILAHLADSEIVLGWRFRMILSQSGEPIQAFDQDLWAKGGRYARREVRHSLALYRAVREANVRLLESLSVKQWRHYGVHSERGRESMADTARLLAGHDLNHLLQIRRILEK
ncbi:MAG: DinB family protein [Acidobacteria bacterium]|nr:DinB family protein [Acidobacteriota bacterium]